LSDNLIREGAFAAGLVDVKVCAIDDVHFKAAASCSSWLNLTEINLPVLNRQCLARHINTMQKITEEVNAWQHSRNNKNAKINWQFTNADARVQLERLYPSIHC